MLIRVPEGTMLPLAKSTEFARLGVVLLLVVNGPLPLLNLET
jgi:hypothetical protein